MVIATRVRLCSYDERSECRLDGEVRRQYSVISAVTAYIHVRVRFGLSSLSLVTVDLEDLNGKC